MSTSSPLRSSPSTLTRHTSSSNRPGQRTYKRRSLAAGSSSIKATPSRPADDSLPGFDTDTDVEDRHGQEAEDDDDAERTLKRKRRETLSRSPLRKATSTSSPLSSLPSSPSRPSKQSKSMPSLPVNRSITPPPKSLGRAGPTTPKHLKQAHRILSPLSSPKDLSALFTHMVPSGSPGASSLGSSAPETPGKKRRARPMLTKAQSMVNTAYVSSFNETISQADSSLAAGSPSAGPSTPSKSLRQTVSEVLTPTRAQETRPVELVDPGALLGLASVAQQQPQPGSGGRAKRIYGRNRTMLAPNASTELGEISDRPSDLLGGGGDQIKQSYAELRRQYEVDNEQDEQSAANDIYADLAIAKAPSAITDMRSKGENRRFMDEVGYLTEGIQDPATKPHIKRASSMDILQHMLDPEWREKMFVCGQAEKIWEAFVNAKGERENEDEIIRNVCLVFLNLLGLFDGPLSALIRSHRESILALTVTRLRDHDDLLDGASRFKKGSLRKPTIRFNEICDQAFTTKPASREVVSYILAAVCASGSGGDFSDSWDQHAVLPRAVRGFSHEVALISARFGLHELGLDLIGGDEPKWCPEHLSNCLSIINSIFLHDLPNDYDPFVDESKSFMQAVILYLNQLDKPARKPAYAITQLLTASVNLLKVSYLFDQHIFLFEPTYTALLRILTFRHKLVDLLAAPPSAPDADPESSFLEDRAARGGVTTSDAAGSVLVLLRTAVKNDLYRHMLSAVVLDPACTCQRACLQACQCPTARPATSILRELFDEMRATTEDPISLVLAGHAALVLYAILRRPSFDDKPLSVIDEDTALILRDSISALRNLEQTFVRQVVGTASVGTCSVTATEAGEPDDQDDLSRALADLDEIVGEGGP